MEILENIKVQHFPSRNFMCKVKNRSALVPSILLRYTPKRFSLPSQRFLQKGERVNESLDDLVSKAN